MIVEITRCGEFFVTYLTGAKKEIKLVNYYKS